MVMKDFYFIIGIYWEVGSSYGPDKGGGDEAGDDVHDRNLHLVCAKCCPKS